MMTSARLFFIPIGLFISATLFGTTRSGFTNGDSLELLVINQQTLDTTVQFQVGEFLVIKRTVPRRKRKKEEIKGILRNVTSDSLQIDQQWFGMDEVTHVLFVDQHDHPYTEAQFRKKRQRRGLAGFCTGGGVLLIVVGSLLALAVILLVFIIEVFLAIFSLGSHQPFENGMPEEASPYLTGSGVMLGLGLLSFIAGGLLLTGLPPLKKLRNKFILKAKSQD